MFLRWPENSWQVQDATSKIAAVLRALMLTIWVFDPYLCALYASQRVNEVVKLRLRIVELVRVQLKLTTLVDGDGRPRLCVGVPQLYAKSMAVGSLNHALATS